MRCHVALTVHPVTEGEFRTTRFRQTFVVTAAPPEESQAQLPGLWVPVIVKETVFDLAEDAVGLMVEAWGHGTERDALVDAGWEQLPHSSKKKAAARRRT